MASLVCDGTFCKEHPRYEIIYDCGIEEQHLILCQKHYDSNPVFKKNVKKIEET